MKQLLCVLLALMFLAGLAAIVTNTLDAHLVSILNVPVRR